jgi:predicted GTPase
VSFDFARARDEVAERLTEIDALLGGAEPFAGWTQREAALDELHAIAERLGARFVLAVVGEFSSGKSFLLNALLGEVHTERRGTRREVAGLLAVDVNPSTATVTEIEFGAEPAAYAYFADGREERVPLDRLARFVAVGGDDGGAHDALEEDRDAPVRVLVRTPSEFLANGYVVADTPGLASLNPAHRRATLGYLPRADAVLYLIDTQQPFSDGDAAFLELIRRDVRSIFIVQTKIDRWRMREADGREAWEAAGERIAQRAAAADPHARVIALSAREYALGLIERDAGAVERSRFPLLQRELARSLAERTGSARIRHAIERAGGLAARARAFLERERDALGLDPTALAEAHRKAGAEIAAREAAFGALAARLAAAAARERDEVAERVVELGSTLQRRLALALDAADVAALRDRAKLHVLIDATVAQCANELGAPLAGALAAELSRHADDAGEPPDPERAALLRRDLVFGILAGPATTLVAAIARGFAAAPAGAYMKRELTGDLRGSIFPAFEAEIAAFAAGFAERVAASFSQLADLSERRRLAVRADILFPLERALAPARGEGLRKATAGALAALERVTAALPASLPPPERPLPDDGAERAAARSATPAIPFDAAAYERGLRPERYRISVFGAMRRGKSSLINAIAGEAVLGDGGAREAVFPIHVRWGPRARASALDHAGSWQEVSLGAAAEAAAGGPVLVEVPWSLPRELVLVHAPAFDAGNPAAEEICIASARASSEVLCLFSRQLSERELTLFERIAALRKPMFFAHTLADHEDAAERREVVELAARYLRERNIKPVRIFTVSARDYAEARGAARAAAPWNELEALAQTIAAHGEAHLARLAELERERSKLTRAGDPGERRAPRGGLAAAFERLRAHGKGEDGDKGTAGD